MGHPAGSFCSLCLKSESEVPRLIVSGTMAAVCTECIQLCNEILEGDDEPFTEEPPPRYVGGERPPVLPDTLSIELFYHATEVMLNTLVLSGEPQPYSTVAPIVGYHHRDRNFYRMLGRSLREDHAAGRPLRASMVINKALGMPGQAYFMVCRELGLEVPKGGEAAFWTAQLDRLALEFSEVQV